MLYIMTAAQFKSKSSKLFAKRKNPIILDIDNLLALFEQSNDNPRRQYKILVLLYVWTDRYIKGGGKRSGVDELHNQVKYILDNFEKLIVDISNQGAHWKNGQITAPNNIQPGQGKTLGDTYKMEPFLPGKGKVGPLELNAEIHRYNMPALKVFLEMEKGVSKNSEAVLASLTPREIIDLYIGLLDSGTLAEEKDFEMCDKTSRAQYRIYISPQGRLYKDAAFTTPLCTTNNPSRLDSRENEAAYAMDLNGFLYARQVTDFADGQFNHSSFMSGKPVICAGIIIVGVGGMLRMISNNSGHYRPTLGDLGRALAVLNDIYQVDLLGVTAQAMTGGNPIEMDAYRAMSIYRNYPCSPLVDYC
jgi:hypothetical protein